MDNNSTYIDEAVISTIEAEGYIICFVMGSVKSAGRDAWKALYSASLLDYTKLKKETEPYMARGLIYTVARGSITQCGAYVWRAVAP